ncbi:type II toxin-antitoxin system YafQ family toxin [Pediococcus damnosus]|uniref:type II toxin-antitoxin system YafQ family toxin n=1 Tax=Pediococcus damnosus TaxID=51663 RepID=UPI00061EFA98|nr:type II toxin-antitoxin system YafQ family toxin [Pediococcus damnosus]KJU73543.1 mRNA interferase YafQ [Pediococcus damnosus LMG 28219]PIO80573.1 mRNA interferase YafQ [Pediococcus damnosus]PIO85854.1 mRNA interferase YafQ [Pediococcus damnosus]PJE49914.1 type II toxin-antitoxin system YafQ family toxin [Pediococcus damnosus]GEA93086.1 addiction module toxin, RelE/StbE family [Pediococcus damnosus]
MYKANPLPTFRRDVKHLVKKHYPIEDLKHVVDLLLEGTHQDELRLKFDDHQLVSNSAWKGHRELHINKSYNNNWLLIYRIDKEDLVLELVRSGSHKDLLGK